MRPSSEDRTRGRQDAYSGRPILAGDRGTNAVWNHVEAFEGED